MSTNVDSSNDIIPSFFVEREESVSEYWRRNKSPVESQELANLLQALRMITSYIGPNTGQVIWSGMRSSDEETDIQLNPGMVIGKYPISGSKTDYAVGTVVIEALRRIEWSDRVRTLVEKKLANTATTQLVRRQMYIDMAETIYLDLVSNRSVLGLYTERLREQRLKSARRGFGQPPTFDELIHIWWIMAADRKQELYLQEYTKMIYDARGYDLELHYKKPLRLLNSIVAKMIECTKISSTIERCEFRANLYLSIWNELLQMTKFWLTNTRDGVYIPKVSDVGEIFDGEPGEALKAITAAVSEEIEVILQNNRDFTDEIRMICRGDDEVVPIKLSDIVLPLEEPIDQTLTYKIFLTLRNYSKTRSQLNRGLKSGRIDKRRLYRAPINGEIFCYKKVKPDLDHDIILLVDATGSMGGPKWRSIQKVYASMYTAMGNLNQRARVFAYNESRGTCFITELTSRNNQLFTIMPRGKTASGEAIIATALMLKSRKKQPFIIHLTDGASNWGTEVKHAIDYCRRKRIKLMTLGFGCEAANKDALRNEYGTQVEFVDTLAEIPEELGKLLTHTFHNC